MVRFLLFSLVSLAAFAATPAIAASAVVESHTKPSLDAYLQDGKLPRYIRINMAGYNVRTTPEFSAEKTDNIAFASNKGALFAIHRMVPLQNGVAVNIVVDGEDRWIYVPNSRLSDFQFCESEACLSDLAQALAWLQNQNISEDNLAECGLALDAQGSLINLNPKTVADAAAESVKARSQEEADGLEAAIPTPRQRPGYQTLPEGKDIPIPTPRPAYHPEPRDDHEVSAGGSRIAYPAWPKTKPIWETSSVPGASRGKSWTKMLVDSLQSYGKDLLRTQSLADAKNWCPNYSRLSAQERQEMWVHLMVGFAKYESDYNVKNTYDEEHGRNVRSGRIDPKDFSQGLFQLSYTGAGQKTYRNFCHFNWSRDRYKNVSDSSLSIYDVKKQMDCAVGILNYWVKKDRGIGYSAGKRHGQQMWRGGARWWSTLRYNNPKTKRVQASMKRFTPCWR